jgi:hypothetical protein
MLWSGLSFRPFAATAKPRTVEFTQCGRAGHSFRNRDRPVVPANMGTKVNAAKAAVMTGLGIPHLPFSVIEQEVITEQLVRVCRT